ncbi:MAG: TIGR04086 family membrane protein [Eubacteriales bacterium]|nr:TIGR04086 family membrane protein [Eubacteriales bacterium]
MQIGTKGNTLLMVLLKASFLGAAASFALLLLFALALQKNWLQLSALGVMTVAIKVASAAAASALAVGLYKRRAWLVGGLAGLCYAALAFLLFSVMSKSFSISLGILSDLGTGALAGVFTALLIRMFR